MPIDILGGIERFEADDTQQLTFTATLTAPQTVAFHIFNTEGTTLTPVAVQSGQSVSASGGGLYYVDRVLPSSAGMYFYQWTAWDSSSRTYIIRREFEVVRTEAFSFDTYANMTDLVRTGRQAFGRMDITLRDLRPYAEAADRYIDASRNDTAVNTVLLREMSKVGALYYFFADRYSFETKDAPPGIVGRWKEYKDLLAAIVAGTLGGKDPVSVLTGGPDSTFKPVFDSREFEDQRVDPDLIDSDKERDD